MKETIEICGKPTICGEDNGQLQLCLAEPNTKYPLAYCGKEKLVKTKENIEKYRGEYGSTRYVYRIGGELVGYVKVTSGNVFGGYMDIMSTIFVLPDYRGKGVGTALVNAVRKDFRRIKLSNAFTNQGAKFFGVM